MNRIYDHLISIQETARDVLAHWNCRGPMPETVRLQIINIKESADAALAPVDDACAEAFGKPIDPLGLSGVLPCDEPDDDDPRPTREIVLDLRAATARELDPGNDHRSGGLNHGAAIKSAEEGYRGKHPAGPRATYASGEVPTTLSDKWDGLSPADVEGDDPDPTIS